MKGQRGSRRPLRGLPPLPLTQDTQQGTVSLPPPSSFPWGIDTQDCPVSKQDPRKGGSPSLGSGPRPGELTFSAHLLHPPGTTHSVRFRHKNPHHPAFSETSCQKVASSNCPVTRAARPVAAAHRAPFLSPARVGLWQLDTQRSFTLPVQLENASVLVPPCLGFCAKCQGPSTSLSGSAPLKPGFSLHLALIFPRS